MKSLDRIAGTLLVRVLPAPASAPVPASPTSFLLIRPGGIGDAVHLVPAVRAIRKAFPLVAVDILAERRNAAIFALSEGVRRVIRYDVPAEFLSLFWEKYDLVIDSEQWHHLSAVVARLVQARYRIGFNTNERSRLFNCSIPYSHEDYEVDSFLGLLGPLDIPVSEITELPWLVVPPDASSQADSLLAPLQGKRFVVIFPGASIPERRWGEDRYRIVAGMLASEGISTVVVGGVADATDGEEIIRGLQGMNVAGKCSLAETAAVIERSAVLVSGDSGILHIGVALGKPTVSLFGPGIAAKWAPRGAGHIVLNRNLDCSPCTKFGTTPPCQDGVRCMAEITAQEVVAAAERLIFPAEAVTG
ncbi:MAG: glycosyltransferase family 9 protein [Geobacter sp.]|nr:glycosyltransferase family 9 protein [Geobacter sp.]